MKEILIVDIETTGFQKDGGSIVEVGIVALNIDTGEVVEVFDSVCREKIFTEKHCREPYGWIFRNSSLTPEDVWSAPQFEELLPSIQDAINKYPLGATAYNRGFDMNFLHNRGVKFGRLIPCPMLLSTPICKLPSRNPRYSSYKWPSVEEAWAHFFPDEKYIELHRGLDDARHEARIVYELYRLGAYSEVS